MREGVECSAWDEARVFRTDNNTVAHIKAPLVVQVRAIDINSCHPRIEQIDFFNLAPAGVYFAVVSLPLLKTMRLAYP